MDETYFNMIAEFAEGTLNSTEEDKLFYLLSSDDEFRTTYKNHLAIKSAAVAGGLSFILSPNSKAAIFDKLNLALPTTVPVPTLSYTEKLSNLWLKNRKYIATAALSVAATLLFVYNPFSAKVNSVNKTAPINNIQYSSLNNNYGLTHSNGYDKGKALKLQTLAVKNISSENAKSNLISNDILNNNPSNNSDFEGKSNHLDNLLSVSKLNSFLPGLAYNEEPNLVTSSNYEPLQINVADRIGLFSFEFRGMSPAYSQSPIISPKNNAAFNNSGLAGLYNLNKNFSFGIDLRQENFYLNYKGTEGADQYNYQQQPNLTSISLVARYKLNGIFGFNPILQGAFGVNSLGPVSRLMAGIEYQFIQNLSLVAGYEYNLLMFKYQNQSFTSSKYNLNYGIKYSF